MIFVSRVHGLVVAAPFPVGVVIDQSAQPDWTIIEANDLPIDAHDRVPSGRVVAGIDADLPFYEMYELDRGRFVFRFHRFADVVIERERRLISWNLLPGSDRGHIEILTAGTVLAAACLLDGHLVLHASAIERDGRAIALVGDSGAGKSTLAAIACVGGAQLVTDDVLRVEWKGGVARCLRGGTALRLRPRSSAITADVKVTSTSADDRRIVTPKLTEHDVLPLAKIVLPRLDDAATAVRLEPLDAHAGALRVLASPRVYGWRHSTARSLFERLMDLAQTIQISELVVPRGRPFDRAAASRLVEMLF